MIDAAGQALAGWPVWTVAGVSNSRRPSSPRSPAATKGTFTGPMATPEGEVPPTDRSYVAPLVAICELTDSGLIAECREYDDTAAFARPRLAQTAERTSRALTT